MLRGSVAMLDIGHPELAVDNAQQRFAQGQQQHDQHPHCYSGTAQPRLQRAVRSLDLPIAATNVHANRHAAPNIVITITVLLASVPFVNPLLDEIMFTFYRAYAVEGFGEARSPRDLQFLLVVAGFAGNHHQN
jgi:hypothetical protein